MEDSDTQLAVITIDDPALCLECNQAHIAEVLFTDGSTRKMFYCSRFDCDNWRTPSQKKKPRQAARRRKAA